MGIDDKDLDGFLGEAFKAGPEESALEAIERLHGAGSSVLLRDSDADASPVLLRRDADGVADDPRYHVLGEIARGGIGVVYKGRDKDLNREVALKVLRPELADRADVIQRFIEEAQVGGQLQHPGIVPVYGLGVQKDGRPSFAMKLIKGNTLAELLANNPPASAKATAGKREIDLLTVFEQVAQTMAYAHSRGVIHRDLKPANVMVGAFGEVQVVDWGFAKVLGQEDLAPRPDHTVIATVRSGEEGSQSIAGSVMGTPAYMPPEQALGQIDELDEASDVFALGAILCEILTGQPPYTGSQKDQLIAASQCLLDPARERLDETDAPEELRQIVRDCLQPLSAGRPRDLADRLANFFAQAEERARQAELDAVTSETKAAREQHAKRRSLVLAGAALLLIVAGASGYLWSWLERTGREERALPRVAAALREAKGFEGEGDWTAALAAARKAVDIAASEGVADGGAAAMLTRFERGKAAADEIETLRAADEELLVELERARALDATHYGTEPKDEAFTAAVRKRWPSMDVDTQRLRESTHATAFAATFEAWAYFRRSSDSLKEKDWRKLEAWARAIDPDSDRLRDALNADDTEALEKLLAEEDRELPVAMIATIGGVLLEAKREKAATAFLRRAHRRHPGDFWINQTLGWSTIEDPQLAVPHLLAALAIRPQSIEARHWLGIALQNAGDFEGALAVWRDALARKPDWAHGLGHVAEVLGKLGRHDEALAAFRQTIREQNHESGHYHRMGAYLMTRRKYKEAAEAFRRLIELDPSPSADVYNWLGSALSSLGDFDGAAEAHRFAQALDPGNLVAGARINAAIHGKREDAEAFAGCRKAVEQEPDNPDRYVELSEHLTLGRKWKEALAALRKAVELRPDAARYHTRLGGLLFILSGRGRNRRALDKAIARFRKAIELDPHDARPHNGLGMALQPLNKVEDALRHLRKAVELDSKHVVARLNLGYALASTGKLDEGIAEMRRALEVDSRNWSGWNHLASLLRQKGDEDGQISARRRAVAINPRLRNDLALTLDGLRRYDEGAAEFRHILEERPEFGCTHYYLGTNRMRKGALEEAIPEFLEAIRIYPTYAEAYCNLGWCYRRLGRWSEAVTWLKKGHKIGAQRNSWRYPSAQWIAQTEGMAALEPRLARILNGEEIEATLEERVVLAEMLLAKRSFPLAAQFYRDAFAADPALGSHGNKHRYRAIRAAAQAGEAWRGQALDWLNAMLENKRRTVSDNPGGVFGDLSHWRSDPALASVRDAADLPDDWKRLWAEARALREKAHRIGMGGRK